jgi:hypothetical protein
LDLREEGQLCDNLTVVQKTTTNVGTIEHYKAVVAITTPLNRSAYVVVDNKVWNVVGAEVAGVAVWADLACVGHEVMKNDVNSGVS